MHLESLASKCQFAALCKHSAVIPLALSNGAARILLDCATKEGGEEWEAADARKGEEEKKKEQEAPNSETRAPS